MDKEYNEKDQEVTGEATNTTNQDTNPVNDESNTFDQNNGFENQQQNEQQNQQQNGQQGYGFYNDPNFQQNYQNQNMNYNQYNNSYQPNFNGNQNGNGNDPKKKGTGHKVLKICAIVGLGIVVGLSSVATLRVAKFGKFAKIDSVIPSENKAESQNENQEADNSSESSSDIKIGSTDVVTDGNDNGVSKVVENTLPSIVMINCTVETTQYGQSAQGVASGSGIIVKEDKNHLYIVTNYHVVSDAKKVSVVFSDEASVEATVKAYDSTNDLAILKISLSKIKDSTKKAIKVATLGSSDKLKVGSMAIAIGNALGYGQSVTVGYVSALDRAVTMDNTTRVLLQTDAAINPGNSGGALLDVNGQVIGINSAKYSSTDVEGVCYAIPISKAIPIINDLMTKETLKDEDKGYLGISGSDVDETAHAYYNVPLGVRVASVEANGAAAKGGIKEKDIITAVNGIQVTSISALKERVNGFKYGTEVTLTVQRQSDGTYKETKIKVKLQKATAANQSSESQSNGSQSNGSGSNGSQDGQNDGGQYYYYYGDQNGNNGFPFNIN